MNKLNANQVEKLIDSIKKNSVIFDKCDKYYKHTARKDKIWRDIAKTVGAEENECKTAWKSLRTQFVKAINGNNRKSGQDSSEKKVYKYFDQLLFLKDSIRRRHSQTLNPKSEPEIEECEMVLYDNDNDTDMFETTEVEDIDHIKAPSVSNDASTPRSTPSPRPSRKMKYNNSPDQLKSNNSQDHEHLKKFLDAILTEIKTANETKTKKDDIQTFFVVIANMVRKANLTRFQNRQIQKNVFNFVTEELDKFDNEA